MYYHPISTAKRGLCGALLCLLLAALPAAAGIPKPSLILYGKVFNGSGELLTSGTLVWSFTPAEGGDPVQVVASLSPFDGPDGPFSYRVQVPLETPVSGFPASGGALPVALAAAEYEQSASVVDTGITFAQSVIISMADVGSAKRVDICTQCPPNNAKFHSADLNRDLKFSLSEFLRVVELHSATPTGDYHVNPNTRDGYGIGHGPRSGTPHSSDFYGRPDWRVTVHELVRMVDLFTATPDHSYSPDSFSEDGFRKGSSGADKGGLRLSRSEIKGQREDTLRLTRRLSPGANGLVDVTIRLGGAAGDRITGFGIADTLPPGWRFHSLRGGLAPFVSPSSGRTGTLEFTWFPAPEEGFEFTYAIHAPGTIKGLFDMPGLKGEGVYRVASTEEQYLLPIGEGPAGGLGGDPGEGGDGGSGSGEGGDGGDGGSGTGGDAGEGGSGSGGTGGGFENDPFGGTGDDPAEGSEGSEGGSGVDTGSTEDDGQPPALPATRGLGLTLLIALLGGAMWRVSGRKAEVK